MRVYFDLKRTVGPAGVVMLFEAAGGHGRTMLELGAARVMPRRSITNGARSVTAA